MRVKRRIFKYILLLIISTSLISLPGIATPRINMTEKLVLTLEDCIDRALNEDADKYQYQNNTLLKRKIELEAMRRGYEQAIAMMNLGESLYTNFGEYQSLAMSETTLRTRRDEINAITTPTAAEIEELKNIEAQLAKLDGYNTAYYPLLGETTPTTLQQSDIFSFYIKPYCSGIYGAFDLEASINSYSLSEYVVKNSISQGVRQLYEILQGLYDNLALLEKQYDIQDRQYRITIASYLNGQIAEIDRIKAGIELDQLKVNIDILKRNIENVELRIKQQIGVWPEQEVEFKPIKTDGNIKEPLPLNDYLNKASDLRIEVIAARSDKTAKDKMFEITKKYVQDSSNDWIEAQIAVKEKSAALDDAKKSVEQDIRAAYNDVMEKKEAIQVARQKFENADAQYNLAKKQYEQGYITESVLWNAELGCLAAKSAYEKATRDYNTALYRLEQASEFGPAYNTTNAGVR